VRVNYARACEWVTWILKAARVKIGLPKSPLGRRPGPGEAGVKKKQRTVFISPHVHVPPSASDGAYAK
jgi:hypothetical protein